MSVKFKKKLNENEEDSTDDQVENDKNLISSPYWEACKNCLLFVVINITYSDITC